MTQAECGIKSVVFRSALGWAGVALSEQGICRIVLPRKNKKSAEQELISAECGERSSVQSELRTSSGLAKAVKLLQQYFSGEHVSFDLPLDLRYYTRFQQAVWKAATEIPYGETRSYAWIAKRIKNSRAARAVGQAMGANPVPIIIP
ncbi:MAG TPA: methylated-DNA--[protein]-cysteine S-methyltransferase [Nitrospirota bacterium]|nr:methylated-DNA--[protein]-cysteine S-methyltransferase [Nitrospirota bacterium]